MRIWTVKIGEPLPIEECDSRPFRTGLLSSTLAERGHEVTWWTSTFFHQEKRQLFGHDTIIPVTDRYRIIALRTPGYRRNISFERAMDHEIMARRFSRLATYEHQPDMILCAFPTIELSTAAVTFGKLMGVPTVLDIRDLWPDEFLEAVPIGLRRLGSIPVHILERKVKRCMRNATALTAMSMGCLEWGLAHAGRSRCTCDDVFPLGYPELDVDPKLLEEAGASLRARGVRPTSVICWFIGMFGKHYDIPTIIAVARELDRLQLHDVQFVLSGDGPETAKWKAMAQGLTNTVFTGRIGPAEIKYMSGIADIALLAVDGVPASLPNKLFEYMAAGLPIVSSLSGEAEILLRNHGCGLTYAPGDSAGLLAILKSLVMDPQLRHRMGDMSARAFRSGYSADAVYGRMASHLERVFMDHRREQLT